MSLSTFLLLCQRIDIAHQMFTRLLVHRKRHDHWFTDCLFQLENRRFDCLLFVDIDRYVDWFHVLARSFVLDRSQPESLLDRLVDSNCGSFDLDFGAVHRFTRVVGSLGRNFVGLDYNAQLLSVATQEFEFGCISKVDYAESNDARGAVID